MYAFSNRSMAASGSDWARHAKRHAPIDEPRRKSGATRSSKIHGARTRSSWLKTSHFGPPDAPAMTENASGAKPSRLICASAAAPARSFKGEYDIAYLQAIRSTIYLAAIDIAGQPQITNLVVAGITETCESPLYFGQRSRVVNSRGDLELLTVGDFFHGTAQHLAGARFWQPVNDRNQLERSHRPNDFAHSPDQAGTNLFFVDIGTRLHHHEAQRQLPLQAILDP